MAHVAQPMRLRGSDVKKRCAALSAPPTPEVSAATVGLIDVTADAAWPLPTPVIESDLQRADGTRRRMQAHPSHHPLETLVSTLEPLSATRSIWSHGIG